ncbi:ankyrin repeat domain-containing protein 53 [Cyprinodon tularosa]|uniref:ankyrin repeat domain-containing protein 53 n=1 Tax=Cyprinodon tularosa TaxID=77115 RepID=UPI0018E23A23|nr:ankyrin repeat domain-containing protein 53 [Cyprinodon tularosa]
MGRTNTSRKRRRGRCKCGKVSPKAPPGGPALPDVAESSEMPEEQQGFHVKCFYSDLPAIQALLESREWLINSSDSHGRRPLHMVLSSRGASNTCLRYLLEHGADVNATTVLGQTPLHFAASEGLLESTEILVKAGADLLAKDKMGLNPLDMAHIWCHRKVARYLKHSMWHCEKKKEMEEIKLTHVLYRDLINKVKQDHLVKKTRNHDKMEEWAKKKGFPPLKELPPKTPVSKYHDRCVLPPTKSQSQGLQKNKVISITTQPTASTNIPRTVFISPQHEKPSVEPDLRESVTVWENSSSHRLQYITKWDTEPQPTPKAPRDVVERVLFPKAFPSRMATPLGFKPQNIEEVQHRGHPQGRNTSPWTEVAMHLAEVLEPGHY